MLLKHEHQKKINFSKMHGLGNDFMVIELIEQEFVFSSSLIKRLSHRNLGVGFDQLLLIEKSNNVQCDFHYRIFNANGNEVEQCGNGARCVGLFLVSKGLTKKKKIILSTNNNIIKIYYLSNGLIKVDMSYPTFKVDNVLYLNNSAFKNYEILIFSNTLKCSLVSIGNPHCIIQVTSTKYAPVQKIGKEIEKSTIFPKGINVGFMEIIHEKHIKLRVYERDVGETQSCGSGACAAVSVGIARNLLSHNVQVDLLGGNLKIHWKGFKNSLYMIGSAHHVFDGYIYI